MPHDVKTLCPYCGVGCGLIATTDGVNVLRVRGDPAHPANFGRVCPKGGAVAQTVNISTRLRHAMVCDRKSGKKSIIPPTAAVNHVAERLGRILQTVGPGGIGFYLSGQLTTEAQHLAGKFAKGCLRTNHCDSNSRLCMSSAASGMALSVGSDGPPTCYADIELADSFLFIGSNAAECHPVTFERVTKRVREDGAKLVVVDPRRTPTAANAHVHLPIRPQSDLAFLHGLLRLMRDWGKLDREFIRDHTAGYDELDAMLDEWPADRVAAVCEIPRDDFLEAARLLADAPRLITCFTMGVSQTVQGTYNTNAIFNLHLATGRIGKPGAGPFSLTGQPNAMGGRDCGYMSHQLPGQRFVKEPEHRAEMERLWNLPPGAIHAQPGYDAVELFNAVERGEIKAIWIIGSNPAASMPNLPRVRAALEKAELVIVQDAYHPTETSAYADIVLPAAVNFEQDGTFCNSERRVTLMRQVTKPVGEAKPDWWWIREVASAMGFRRGMSFQSAAEIFDDFTRCTAGRPNDQSGLSHALLAEAGPQQWPFPAGGESVERRYADGIFPTPGGRARLWARPVFTPDERPSDEFPFILTTGRTLNQWHTRTKTGAVEQLNKQDPASTLRMHPDDVDRLNLEAGERIEIVSRRGTAYSTLQPDEAMSPGCVFLPIHWNELWSPGASPNEATSDECDPISKQPTLKYCAVAVRQATPPHKSGQQAAALVAPESVAG